MRIRLLTGLAGNRFSWAPGEEHDLPGAEAKRLIAAGKAEPVEAEQAVADTSRVERRGRRKAKRGAGTDDSTNE